MFFKDFVSVKRKKIKKGASQTYDTPSFFISNKQRRGLVLHELLGSSELVSHHTEELLALLQYVQIDE